MFAKRMSFFSQKLTCTYIFYGKPWRDKYTSYTFKGQKHSTNCVLIQSITTVFVYTVLLLLFQWASSWFAAKIGWCNTWQGNFRGSRLICHPSSMLNWRVWPIHRERRARFQLVWHSTVIESVSVKNNLSHIPEMNREIYQIHAYNMRTYLMI